MISNNSLKEYYVKLQEQYENAVNILTAINQSLTTTASEITVPIMKDNYIESEVRIPSFLYLENKLEQLSTNFANLFEMPDSGEAWMTNNSSQFKLSLLRANSAPTSPIFSNQENIVASITDNNFLKDLVSPKTFLKVNIDNIPLGCSSVLMKKMVIYSPDMYHSLERMGLKSYEDVVAALYNFSKGKDYDEYDSEINMPCRRDKYKSRFEIVEVPEKVGYVINPYIDESTNKLTYHIKVDTLTYHDKDDSSITFSIKGGDYLVLGNSSTIYRVKNVDSSEMSLDLEEYVGHTPLQTYKENTEMVLSIYNASYKEYDYVQVPLEENPYILVFLATIYNNVQSAWSEPLFFDLNSIYIKDAGNNFILDEFGNRMSYIDYYNKYCVNIGDLILGLTETAYPQVSNYSPNLLEMLQDGSQIKTLVDSSWDNENVLKVVPINKHLTDDNTSDEIMNLHQQKNELNAQMSTNQANINNVYNKLLTTDFSAETTFTQAGLQDELNRFYSERTVLQKQLNAVIDAINAKALDVKVISSDVKYRVRGITNVDNITSWLHENFSEKTEIISMEVQYKYKSPNKDTNTITNINQSTFTDWIRQSNIERERKLVFSNSGTQGFGIEYEDYSSTNNIIKWNQIDIPIKQGEDVIIRIRYKYNIGQPFINVYTPWSSDLMMVFPSEFEDDVDLTTILDDNAKDTVNAGFRKTLIDDGYDEHIHNSLMSNEQKFFHLPENIYSGFNTAENNLISLKDKLLSMNSELEKWKSLLDNESNAKFEVYINYDETNVQLTPNAKNKINIYNTNHVSNSFIKKEMKLIIKNTGDVRLNLYSIFPGNVDTYLIDCDVAAYSQRIQDYERVPIYINYNLTGQYLGQWIYFRQNNPYTGDNIYYYTQKQNNLDYNTVKNNTTLASIDSLVLNYEISPKDYMADYRQACLGFKNRAGSSSFISGNDTSVQWCGLKKNTSTDVTSIELFLNEVKESTAGTNNLYVKAANSSTNWFIYPLTLENNFITRFEDIAGISHNTVVGNSGSKVSTVYLDEGTNIETFIDNYSPENFKSTSMYAGGFLFPNILSKELIMTEGNEKDSKYVEVGESLTIPIIFEYFSDEDHPSISKSLYFDLRNSLISDPKHFMIEVIGHHDYTSTNDIYTNNITISTDVASDSDME